MESIFPVSVILLVIFVMVSECYKARFEKSAEAKDERGQLILLKSMSLSYKFLVAGVFTGFFLLAITEWISRDVFIFYILYLFMAQSLVSAIYFARMLFVLYLNCRRFTPLHCRRQMHSPGRLHWQIQRPSDCHRRQFYILRPYSSSE